MDEPLTVEPVLPHVIDFDSHWSQNQNQEALLEVNITNVLF